MACDIAVDVSDRRDGKGELILAGNEETLEQTEDTNMKTT